MALSDKIYIFFAINYFAQGMSGVVYEPLSYLLKDGFGLTAGQSAGFVAWMTFPYVVKPLFGLATDMLPWKGKRRAPAIMLAAAAATGSWLWLSARPRPGCSELLALLIVINIAIASTDVICDAVMVERGKRLGKTGVYQAVQIGTLYATLLVTGLGGGWLAAHIPIRRVFALSAVFPLLIFISSAWIQEPAAASPARRAAQGLLALARRPRFWILGLFIFLYNFYPFLGTAEFYYQSETLRLSPVLIGMLTTIGGVAGLAGAAFYGSTIGRRWRTADFIRASVWIGGPASLLYLFYRGPASAAALEALFGFIGVVFRLALMDFSAQSCPEFAEATSFAAYISVFNLAAYASNAAGGKLYEALQTVFAARAHPAHDAAAVLMLVGSACTFACAFLLPYLKEGPGLAFCVFDSAAAENAKCKTRPLS